MLRQHDYSARAWLTAVFVAVAVILGGGGSPNPKTELLLELIFVLAAIAWAWLDGNRRHGSNKIDPLVVVLVAIPLVVPVVQLIPLPPGVWTGLPFRQDALAALTLAGAQNAWKPISLSPSRTIASLLAIIPAVGCLYAVARLTIEERRLVLVTIVTMGLLTSAVGAVQLVAGSRGFNLYPEFHIGWVTGFQANRNATADVLLICLLALLPLAAPYLDGSRRRLPLSFDRRAFSIVIAALATILIAALVMTGSRAGIMLVFVPLGAALVTVWQSERSANRRKLVTVLLVAAAVMAVIVAIFGLGLLNDTAIDRVERRFLVDENGRTDVWQDTWLTLKQYWPIGFGLGGFQPAYLAVERLAFVDPRIPNRAHNEYLEIGLEAGLLGYAMIAAAAVTVLALARRAWVGSRGLRGQIVFGLAVLIVITLHSFVDYPLRSMSLACLAGVAGGMLARRPVRAMEPTAQEGELMKDMA
jgi:O-antigen ligase